MNSQELTEYNRSRNIMQIGFVTRDLQKTMKNWVDYLKIGPWKVLTLSDESVVDPRFRVNGVLIEVTEPFKFYCAMAKVGDMQFELIQPVYGQTIYQKFLDEKGEGIHHFKERISDIDWDNNLAYYESRDMPVTQSGLMGKALYAYVDSEPVLDFVLEFGNGARNDAYPPGSNVYYYPEED